MPTITIISFRRYDSDSQVLAFFTIELDFSEGNRLTLYDLKLVSSKNGDDRFVSPPQRKADNGKYYNYYYLSPSLMTQVKKIAEERYNKE
jgi:DNA-binding cell septation regulator SpoVG